MRVFYISLLIIPYSLGFSLSTALFMIGFIVVLQGLGRVIETEIDSI